MSVPPATQKPWILQITGLSEWKRDMKPRRFRDIIWKSTTGSQVCAGSWLPATTAGSVGAPPALLASLRSHDLGGGQVVAAAEAGPVAGQRNHVNEGVEIGLLDRGGELGRHLERDPVSALRAVQRDPPDRAVPLVGEGRQFCHSCVQRIGGSRGSHPLHVGIP